MIAFPYRVGLFVLILIAAFIGGFFVGQKFEQAKIAKASIAAYQNAGDIQNEVNTLDDYALCLRLSGVPDNCKILVRGLDKTTQSK